MTQAATLRELGAVIDGTGFCFHACGAYGAIFVDRENRRVRKVLFRKSQTSLEIVEDVFNDEVRAYEIAQRDPTTAMHIPKFYGRTNSGDICDAAGQPLDDHFCPHFAYEMDFIEGQDIKLNDSRYKNDFEKMFGKAGVNFLTDASIFEGVNPPMIIDFGMVDPEPGAEGQFGLWS